MRFLQLFLLSRSFSPDNEKAGVIIIFHIFHYCLKCLLGSTKATNRLTLNKRLFSVILDFEFKEVVQFGLLFRCLVCYIRFEFIIMDSNFCF